MVKKLKWNLVLMSVLYLGLGIFLVLKPGTALNIVCYALGGVVLACAALTLFVSNALPNVAGMGSVETAFLLVYGSFLPDAASMSLLMFYRLASYYATFAASAVGFGLAQRRLNRS